MTFIFEPFWSAGQVGKNNASSDNPPPSSSSSSRSVTLGQLLTLQTSGFLSEERIAMGLLELGGSTTKHHWLFSLLSLGALDYASSLYQLPRSRNHTHL